MPGEISQLKNARARCLIYSEQGEAWLEENPSFIELAGKICRERAPEDILRNHSTYIGSGVNSEVRGLAGVAVKVSSPTTGRKAYKIGSGKPENLVDQFRFLTALGQYLSVKTDRSITTPEQYFAFRTPYGSYVRAEQHMNDWTSLAAFTSEQSWRFTEKERDVNEAIKGRIKITVRHPSFRLGLNDLGLEKKEPFHSGNVLVPNTLEDLDNVPLCIIDQPGPHRGYLGKLSLALTNN